MSDYKDENGKIFPNFLILLFFVEMWERFSYYGMRALLVLFLTSYLGFEDKYAYVIYSLFAAIGYAFPVIGGVLADRIMGFSNMVLIGGVIISLGHIAMAFSGNNQYMIFWALSLLGVGAGLFKGNITNLLGACYKDGNERRGQGFTLFYVGINLGAFVASIACGWVAQVYGWHYGFGIAAIGMLIGLVLFVRFEHILKGAGKSPRLDLIDKKFFGLKPFWILFLSAIAISFIFAKAFVHSAMFANVLTYFGIVVLVYYIYIIYQSDAKTRPNLYLIAIMMIMMMIFFALEMQLGSLINLFSERNVEKHIFGLYIPASVSQAINPVAIIIIGFVVGMINTRREYDILKIFLSIVAMAFCFLILYYGCLKAGSDGQINYLYLVAGIGIMSLGEVLIAPIVQSYVSLLAPNHLKGVMMGMLMFALAFSNLAGIVISEFVSVPSVGGQVDVLESLEIYKNGFLDIAKFHAYVAIGFLPFGIYMYKIIRKI